LIYRFFKRIINLKLSFFILIFFEFFALKTIQLILAVVPKPQLSTGSPVCRRPTTTILPISSSPLTWATQQLQKNPSSYTADVTQQEAPQTLPVPTSPSTIAQNLSCATPSACPGD